MSKFRISLIQSKVFNSQKEIFDKVELLIREAYSTYKPEIIILPEFWIGKYNKDEFLNLAEFEHNSVCLSLLSKLAKELNVYLIGGSVAELVHKKDKLFSDKHLADKDDLIIYNTAYGFNRKGEITAKYRKSHLFDVNIKGGITFKESDNFGYGEGFTVFETEYGNIGIGICYDIRFPEFTKMYKEKFNCDIMVFPSNFSQYTGTLHWDILMKTRAVDNNCFFIKCCPSRNYETPNVYQSYGHSQIISPEGKILATCSYEEGIVNTEIDLNRITEREKAVNLKDNRRSDMYKLINKKENN